jgi:hypothetical protein
MKELGLLKKFQISTRESGRFRTVQVFVYGSVEELRKAAICYANRNGQESPNYYANAEGVASYMTCGKFQENDPKGTMTKDPPAGLIRLWAGALAAGVVMHEILHIAIDIYEDDCFKRLGFPGQENIKAQEVLCYIAASLTGKLVDRLYKYDLIPNVKKYR